MTDCMLDLETLSVRSDAAIVIIGAIKFNRHGKLQPMDEMDTFYRLITLESCTDVGLRVDKSTVEWWKTQPHKVQYEALQNPERIPLARALDEFAKWLGHTQYVWGNGDDFDCTILGEAYSRCNKQVPWKFWNTRDVRTVYDLAGIRKYDLPDGDDHHALFDCYRQIVGVKRGFKKLKVY